MAALKELNSINFENKNNAVVKIFKCIFSVQKCNFINYNKHFYFTMTLGTVLIAIPLQWYPL
jgi:hypothetical protein